MNKSLSKTALIIGIISVALATIECYLPLIIAGIVLGVVALVIGIIANKKEKDNLSFAGIVLGACGIIVALIWLYLYIIA